MNLFTYLMLLVLPLSVSASSIFKCHPREGKFGHSEKVAGNLVIRPNEVVWFQTSPVFDSVTFDLRLTTTSTSRTGGWITYTTGTGMNQETVNLQVNDSGSVRMGYLSREENLLALKCFGK